MMDYLSVICVPRPWYVEAATVIPKDIVVAIDRSGSMGRNKSMMSIAREAAKTVVGTLNPNDRVRVTCRQGTCDL